MAADKTSLNQPAIERFLDEKSLPKEPLKDLITEDDTNKICKYLKNPISSGIWVLNGVWLETKGVTAKVIGEAIALEERTTKTKKKTAKEIEESVKETAQGISFTLRLFCYLSSNDEVDKKRFLSDLGKDEILLIEAIEKSFRELYKTEIEYFKENIVCSAFNPTVNEKAFKYVKDGLILPWQVNPINQPERPIKFFSLEPQPLEKMANFFKSLGKLGEYSITPIYSPEDEVFEPYAMFLEIGESRIFERGKIRNLIEQSISILQSGNYAYCISTVGLVFEEQLTQIYETLFRSKCPQGLTLGELLDLINIEVKNRSLVKAKKSVSHALDFNDIYKTINTKMEAKGSAKITHEGILKILRDMLTLIKENNVRMHEQLRTKSNKRNNTTSIFPIPLLDGMDELIRFRNAISHRSRTPIGDFEATKSIFDLVSLNMWWRDEKKLVKWTDSPEEIIREMVKRNNPEQQSII
jgi:hypothetical protein